MGGYEFTSVFSFSVMRTLQKNWTNKFIFEWIINKEVSKNSLTLHIKNDTSFSSGLKQLRFYKVVIKFRAELYRGSSISVLICIRWKFWDLESRQIDLLDLPQLVGLQLLDSTSVLTHSWETESAFGDLLSGVVLSGDLLQFNSYWSGQCDTAASTLVLSAI